MKKKFLKSLCLSLALISSFSVIGYCSDIDGACVSENNIIDAKVYSCSSTLLHCACEVGDLDTVKYLLERSANVNIVDFYENTPLHIACKYGHLDIVKLLLDNGANIENKNDCGYSPLHTAVLSGNTDIVKFLLDNGADIESKDCYGSSSIHHAFSNIDILSMLVDYGANIKSTGLMEFSVLHNACSYGDGNIVQFLLEHGANPNAINDFGCYPIHYARNAETIDLLLKYGADINQKPLSSSGVSPLHNAIDDLNLIQILLDRHADINITNSFGNTALICALDIYEVSENEDVIKLLLDNGADVNIKNIYGEYALNYALRTGNEDIIKLISEKSSIDAINSALLSKIR